MFCGIRLRAISRRVLSYILHNVIENHTSRIIATFPRAKTSKSNVMNLAQGVDK